MDLLPPPLSLSQIQSTVRQIWDRHDCIDVFNLENGFVLFNFENPQTRSWVLEGGPWFIAQHPLLLKKWVPGISSEKFFSSKIHTWINLKGIPMELFANEGISHITNVVGVPLFMDKTTELRNRLSFALVFVEISHDDPLPSSIHVDIEDFGSIEITVEYPWKPQICAICKQTGPKDRSCKNVKRVWRPMVKESTFPKAPVDARVL